MTSLVARAQTLLGEIFGYSEFRGQQAEIITHVAAGNNCLVLMPTGGGKSLCYQLPALLRNGVAIVISPLIALMENQVTVLREHGVRAACLNSSLTFEAARAIEQEMLAGDYDLVYVAPERLLTARFHALLQRIPVALFAIDEAHCVSQWGHDFRPEYGRLSFLPEKFPHVPRIALTASADARTRADILRCLDLNQARVFISSFDRPNLCYRITARSNSRRQLVNFIHDQHADESGIVYCQSRKKTEETAAWPIIFRRLPIMPAWRQRHARAIKKDFCGKKAWLWLPLPHLDWELTSRISVLSRTWIYPEALKIIIRKPGAPGGTVYLQMPGWCTGLAILSGCAPERYWMRNPYRSQSDKRRLPGWMHYYHSVRQPPVAGRACWSISGNGLVQMDRWPVATVMSV